MANPDLEQGALAIGRPRGPHPDPDGVVPSMLIMVCSIAISFKRIADYLERTEEPRQ